MLTEKIKKSFQKAKPKIFKTLTNTAQGYLFGCMVGLFTTKNKPTLTEVHSSGKRLCQTLWHLHSHRINFRNR
ncbi:translocase TIM22/17 [Nosema bombycis CQ1]|uniref:Translocase TIM22/17 n=1 Tax=Nosema bombycis (strain CQ1 / CVCC 102059) TaxID=578461 RepID=R0KWB6_NOSB1|nr:translocase TIM22/17 [Nosema bombycis CQ1]|eukprot:EOB14502.1 translocase TIM22/17 [Nosema bombycis CQ1]